MGCNADPDDCGFSFTGTERIMCELGGGCEFATLRHIGRIVEGEPEAAG